MENEPIEQKIGQGPMERFLTIAQFKGSGSNRAGSNGARCNEFGSNGVCIMERSLTELVRFIWGLTERGPMEQY